MTRPGKPNTPLRLVSAEPAARLDTQAEPAARLGDAHELNSPLSLEQAYRSYAPYVAAIARRIVGSDAELDDLVQDVFLDAARGLSQLREPAALKGWLGRIAVRVSVRRLRARRLRAVLWPLGEALDYDAIAAPDASPEQRALVARVYRALAACSAAQQGAWVLRHMQGETLEAGASLCGCSLSTYQRRLRSAEARLQRELGDD